MGHCVDGEDAVGVSGVRRIWKRWTSLSFFPSWIDHMQLAENLLGLPSMLMTMEHHNRCSGGAPNAG
ncbi:hypothetical protein ACLOJK_027050, partial [Asimina triloba]